MRRFNLNFKRKSSFVIHHIYLNYIQHSDSARSWCYAILFLNIKCKQFTSLRTNPHIAQKQSIVCSIMIWLLHEYSVPGTKDVIWQENQNIIQISKLLKMEAKFSTNLHVNHEPNCIKLQIQLVIVNLSTLKWMKF